MEEKVVIGVVGMPGAGKATVREMVEAMKYPVVVMGDVIREETKRRKLEPTPENIGYIMLKLREEEGLTVVAKRCIPKIKDAKDNVVIVDGIRSLHEVEELKRHFPKFVLIAVHASTETRFRRLFERGRSDDPRNREAFAERDSRELSVGLGNAIATADYLIVNEGTKAQLESKIRKVLETVIRK